MGTPHRPSRCSRRPRRVPSRSCSDPSSAEDKLGAVDLRVDCLCSVSRGCAECEKAQLSHCQQCPAFLNIQPPPCCQVSGRATGLASEARVSPPSEKPSICTWTCGAGKRARI